MSSNKPNTVKWSKEQDLALLVGMKRHGTKYAQIYDESPILQDRLRESKDKVGSMKRRWKMISEDKESEYAPLVEEIEGIWQPQPRGIPRWGDESKLELLSLVETYGYDYAKILSASENMRKSVAHLKDETAKHKRLQSRFYQLLHSKNASHASKAQEIREAQQGKKTVLRWTDGLERELIEKVIENGRDFNAVLASSDQLSLFLSFAKDSKVTLLRRKWKNLVAAREQKHTELFEQWFEVMREKAGRPSKMVWNPELDQELLDQLEDAPKQLNASVFEYILGVSERLREAGEGVKHPKHALRNRWKMLRDGGVLHLTAAQRLQIETIRREFEARKGVFDKDNPNNLLQVFLNAMEEALRHPNEPLFKQMLNASPILKEHTRSLKHPVVRLRGIYHRLVRDAHPEYATQIERIKDLLRRRRVNRDKLWTEDADQALLDALVEALKTSSSKFYQQALQSSPLLTSLLSTKNRPYKRMRWRYSYLKSKFYVDYAAKFQQIEELKQARQARMRTESAAASHDDDDDEEEEDDDDDDEDDDEDGGLSDFDADFGNMDDELDELEELEWDSLESAAAAAAAAPSSSSEALSTKRSKRATESWQDYIWAASAADDLESL
jgi:hypothetical protein